MKMENFITNGDFADGKLPPWISIGSGVAVYGEDPGHYVRLSKGGVIQQNPEVPPNASKLQFKVRTRESLNEGEFILFSAVLAFSLNAGGVHVLPFVSGASSSEWQEVSWEIERVDASDLVIQIRAMAPDSNSSRLLGEKAPFGMVEFKDFALIGFE